MANEDILVDLTVPKINSQKDTTVKYLPAIKQLGYSVTSIATEGTTRTVGALSCATGILIDFDDSEAHQLPCNELQPQYKEFQLPCDEFQPPCEKKMKAVPLCRIQKTDSSPSGHPDLSSASTSDSFILDMEGISGIAFDLKDEDEDLNIVLKQNSERCSQQFDPLSACEMAEIFEQANTVAVRIELANAKLCTPIVRKCTTTEVPSSESGGEALGRDTLKCLSPESPFKMFTSSTPLEKIAPSANLRLPAVFSANRNIREEKPKPTGQNCVFARESLKRPLTHSQERKTTIGHTPLRRIPTRDPGSRVMSAKIATASRASEAKNSTAQCAIIDSVLSSRPAKPRVSLLPQQVILPEPRRKTRLSDSFARTPGRNPPLDVRPLSVQRVRPELHDKVTAGSKVPSIKTQRNVGKENVDDRVSKPSCLPTTKSCLPSKMRIPRSVVSKIL